MIGTHQGRRRINTLRARRVSAREIADASYALSRGIIDETTRSYVVSNSDAKARLLASLEAKGTLRR